MRKLWGRRGDFLGIDREQGYRFISLPKKLFQTKSHEFWVLLSVVVHKWQPRSILELGSGRSTIFLSEYAGKRGAEFVSVDQDRRWVAVSRLICRMGGLSPDFVHYVPLQADGFYSVDRLAEIVPQAELVYIDGPVGRGSTESQLKWLSGAVANARCIVLDDVQRRHIRHQVELLAEASGCSNKTFVRYREKNCLCLFYRDEIREIVEGAIDYLGVPTLARYDLKDCPES